MVKKYFTWDEIRAIERLIERMRTVNQQTTGGDLVIGDTRIVWGREKVKETGDDSTKTHDVMIELPE